MARRKILKFEGPFLNKVKTEFKKGINLRYRFYRLKWNYAPRLGYVCKFPIHLDIESTNTCNLKCIMCPHSNPGKEFKKSLGFMNTILYKKIIDQGVKNGLCSIKLNWRGEPLIHPKIAEMIKYAKDNGIIEVQINTNGQLLNKSLSEKLISAGLDRIIFSIDGVKKETYEKIRVGGNYETLINNVKTFIMIRDQKKLKKPLVRIQFVKMDCNRQEVDDFISFWKPYADEITTTNYTWREEGGELKLKQSFDYKGRLPCPQIWQRITISWDGKATLCCRDWNLESPIGVINDKTTLKDIWNSKVLNDIRKLHKQKRLDEVPICKKCTQEESYDWKR